jgi:tetratricopeptide (TPR) repeat protein
MRGSLPTVLLLLLALPAGCWAEPPVPESPGAGPRSESAAGVPAWVPGYTPQQAVLLTPPNHEVKAPAQRVFPDLERFGYANNRPLAADADAVKFTRMVNKILNDSARFYALDELPPGAANPITQYGPLPEEPDGFRVVKRDAEGLGELVPAPGADEARELVARGAEMGNVESAVELYRAALVRTPRVPALRVALAAALARSGHAAEAEAAYREAIGVDPTYAPAHFGFAELAERRGDHAAALKALVEGLAYHPSSPRGFEMLAKQAGGAPARPRTPEGGWYDPPAGGAAPPTPRAANRVEPFPLFLDVDAAGVIHAATGTGEAAQIYGGCRAVMRHEPQVRAQIFQQPRELPYYLSVAEEVICLEAGLGAYLSGKGPKNDPDLDLLLRIAREDGLSGYVMFEILGQHRPERARAAPADVHRDITGYLQRWVLTKREPPSEGIYTARR